MKRSRRACISGDESILPVAGLFACPSRSSCTFLATAALPPLTAPAERLARWRQGPIHLQRKHYVILDQKCRRRHLTASVMAELGPGAWSDDVIEPIAQNVSDGSGSNHPGIWMRTSFRPKDA